MVCRCHAPRALAEFPLECLVCGAPAVQFVALSA